MDLNRKETSTMNSFDTSTPYEPGYIHLTRCSAKFKTKISNHTLRYGIGSFWHNGFLRIEIKNKHLKVFSQGSTDHLCKVNLMDLEERWKEDYTTKLNRNKRNRVKFSNVGENMKLTFYKQDEFNQFKEAFKQAQKKTDEPTNKRSDEEPEKSDNTIAPSINDANGAAEIELRSGLDSNRIPEDESAAKEVASAEQVAPKPVTQKSIESSGSSGPNRSEDEKQQASTSNAVFQSSAVSGIYLFVSILTN